MAKKNALEHEEQVCLILWKTFIQNLSEHRAFSTVVVLIAVLVLSLPLAKAHHEHAEGLVLSPKSVLGAGANEELIVGIGMMDLPIELQMGAIIKEMEKLVSDLVRMQTGTFARANKGQVNRAALVANHHIDITPGPLRLDCLLFVPGVGIFNNSLSIPNWAPWRPQSHKQKKAQNTKFEMRNKFKLRKSKTCACESRYSKHLGHLDI